MNAIVTVDPLSGEFLIFGKGGELYRFDVIADRWGAVESPVPIFSPAREPDTDRRPTALVAAAFR